MRSQFFQGKQQKTTLTVVTVQGCDHLQTQRIVLAIGLKPEPPIYSMFSGIQY